MNTTNNYCSRCKVVGQPLIKYSKRGSYQYYQCRPCNNSRARKYYSENKEKCRAIIYKSIEKHIDKQRARQRVRDAIVRGLLIKPTKCQECKAKTKIQAHHTDYSQPLLVQWLCVDCHCNKHKQEV